MPLLILAVLGAAAPWTVGSERLSGGIARQLASSYGLDLRVSGRTSIAFLPTPRVKFARVSLSANGTELVRDAQLKGELRLLPLLAGRVELGEVSLSGGAVLVGRDADGASAWSTALRRALAAGNQGAHTTLRRIVVAGSDMVLRDGPSGLDTIARRFALVAAWPSPSGALDIVASAVWQGEAIEAHLAVPAPATLLRGGAERTDLTVGSRHARLSLSGEVDMRGALRFVGPATLDVASIGALARWIGFRVVSGELDRSLAVKGEADISADGVGISRLALDLGRDTLEGALFLGLTGGGVAIQATLAAGGLDLGWLAETLRPALERWVKKSDPLVGSKTSIDLRLSASDLRIGPLRVTDAAASLAVADDKAEATLMRAGLEGGSIKARLAATLGGPRRGFRVQGSIDNVEAGALLTALGWPGYLKGRASGQASLDSAAESQTDLLRHLGGRLALTLRRGELFGSEIADALRNADPKPAVSLARRAAVTGFDQAQLALTLANGVAEVVEGTVDGGAITASLEGRVSLPDRFVSLRAIAMTPAGLGDPRSGVVVDVNGPWNSTTALPGPPPTEPLRAPVTR